MKLLSIDRFESDYAVCEDDNKKVFEIPILEIPPEAREGDIIRILDDSNIIIDKEETKKRRERILKLQKTLFK